MAATMLSALPVVGAKAVIGRGASLKAKAVANGATTTAKLLWLPGGTGKLNPSYLDGSLPGCVPRDGVEARKH